MGVDDVSRAYTLFLDVQRSTQFMVDHADQARLHVTNSSLLSCLRNLSVLAAWTCVRRVVNFDMLRATCFLRSLQYLYNAVPDGAGGAESGGGESAPMEAA